MKLLLLLFTQMHNIKKVFFINVNIIILLRTRCMYYLCMMYEI